jgi:predicted tellurium resistance membrane protein TerC
MVMRIGLLLTLAWMMRLTKPLFTMGKEISGRDLILIGGGLFLLAKSVLEIHSSLEGGGDNGHGGGARAPGFYGTLVQIAVIDIVFSLDSVITAVGMVSDIPVMVLAILIAVAIMMFAAKPIGDFVDQHPTIKMLALAFLILVGVALIGEGVDLHIPKGYIYFAMAFSFGVEMLNLRLRKARKPIQLRKEISEPLESDGGKRR